MHFNKDELRVLCHDIGINAEDLPRNESGVSVWALELVEYARRHGRIPRLLAKCAELRPAINWPSLPNPQPIIGDLTQNAQQASASIMALYALMQQPHIASLAGAAKSELKHTLNAFISLTDFKDLHDYLHQLQYHCYNFLTQGEQRYASDSAYQDELPNHIDAFLRVVIGLQAVIERPNPKLAYEKLWVQRLSQTHNLLRTAIEADDVQSDLVVVSLKRCVKDLKSVISRQPATLNAYIVNTARNIPLQNLINELNKIYATIHPSSTLVSITIEDENRNNQFATGLATLSQLASQLNTLIALHDDWQRADTELREIERNPLQTLIEEERWQDVWQIVLPLCEVESEGGYQQAKKAGQKLDMLLQRSQTLSEIEQNSVKRQFKSFRSAVSNCFYQVDIKLKNMCDILSRDIQPQLNQVLALID